MKHREKLFAVLPTLLTLGNGACGFGAITFAAKIGPTNLGGHELFYAALLIFAGMVFDMLDGSAARLTNQTSEFGAQLDSLCDAVTFGVAPAFLMLQFVREYLPSLSHEGMEPLFLPNRLLWVIAVLFVLCVILRLARFNVETDEEDSHEFFSGLPSPAAAGAVAAFPIAMGGLQDLAVSDRALIQPVAEWLVPAMQIAHPLITFLVACLMVSRIRYAHVFNQLFRGKRSRQHLIQLLFALSVVFLVPPMALPLLFCYFAFAAPLRACWTEVARPRILKTPDVTPPTTDPG
ncbi:MAG: phosphatidylcholine/phosphatidylserine synthase [Planctomycetota bacterium]|nr:phosphatidylcholine/phosphatidylserine synthase [Planctomycetota bacterium]